MNLKILKLFFLIVFIHACNNTSRVKVPEDTAFELIDDFDPVLRKGTYAVVYFASTEVSRQQKAIFNKLAQAIQTNEKARQFFNKASQGQTPEYNPDMGINRKEYQTVLDLFSNKPRQQKSGTLVISRDGDVFNFKGQERLALLDSLTVNVKKNSATFKHYTMFAISDSN